MVSSANGPHSQISSRLTIGDQTKGWNLSLAQEGKEGRPINVCRLLAPCAARVRGGGPGNSRVGKPGHGPANGDEDDARVGLCSFFLRPFLLP